MQTDTKKGHSAPRDLFTIHSGGGAHGLSSNTQFHPQSAVNSLWKALGAASSGLPTGPEQGPPSGKIRQAVGGLLNKELMARMDYLSRETDPQLFFHGVLGVAQQAFAEGNYAVAGPLLQILSQPTPELAPWVPQAVREGAEQRFAVLQNKGSWGRRLEFQGSHFLSEVLNPGTLGAIGVAQWVFGSARLGLLKGLLNRPAAWWTRGAAARAIATAGAFPAEVLSFWGTSRAYGLYKNPELLAWDGASIRKELGALSLTLGLLKMGSWLGTQGFQGIHLMSGPSQAAQRLAKWTPFTRPAFHQAGMLGGILSGHSVEVSLGLREATTPGQTLMDSLVLLAQFNTMGAVLHRITPRMFRHQVALESQADSQAPSFPWRSSEGLSPLFGSELQTSWGPRFSGNVDKALPGVGRPPIFLSEGSENSSSKDSVISETKGIGKNPHPSYVRSLVEIFVDPKVGMEMKRQLGRELYPHRDMVIETLEELSSGEKKRAGQILDLLQRYHLESIAETMHEWYRKFSLLEIYLKERIELTEGAERDRLDEIYLGVKNKRSFTHRQYNRTQSYLFEDPMTRGDRYPPVERKFQGILRELEEYFQKHPEMENVLENYRGDMASRLEVKEIESLIQKIEEPWKKLLLEAMRYGDPHFTNNRKSQDVFGDPNLNIGRYTPLRRYLEKLTSGLLGDQFTQLRKPIDQYMQALEKLTHWTHGERLFNLQKDFSLLDLSAEKLQELHGLTPGELDQQLGAKVTGLLAVPVSELKHRFMVNPNELVDNYLSAAKQIRKTLNKYRLTYEEGPSLKWDKVQEDLKELGQRGQLPLDLIDELLRWYEGTDEKGIILSLANHKTEAVAGMIEFLFNEIKDPSQRKTTIQFIEEVLSRNDKEMLDNLTFSFAGFRSGAVVGPVSSAQFLKNILQTANFYLKYPNFKGPYLDIVERLNRGSHTRIAQIVNPIDQKIQNFIAAGDQVHLNKGLSFGQGLLEVVRDPKNLHSDSDPFSNSLRENNVIAVTMIHEPLSSRKQMQEWSLKASKMFEEMNGDRFVGEDPLKIISIHIPKISRAVDRFHVPFWGMDAFENLPEVDLIHLYLPKKGREVSDPFDPKEFHLEILHRGSLTQTDGIIWNLEKALARTSPDDPRSIATRLEIISLKKQRLEAGELTEEVWQDLLAASRIAPHHPSVRAEMRWATRTRFQEFLQTGENQLLGFPAVEGKGIPIQSYKYSHLGTMRHYQRVAEFFEAVLNRPFARERVANLFNLTPVEFHLRQLKFDYTPRGIELVGWFEPLKSGSHQAKEVDPGLVDQRPLETLMEVVEPGVLEESNMGRFDLTLVPGKANRKNPGKFKPNQMLFGHFGIPIQWRLKGAGTHLFSEVLRLARDAGVENIYSEGINYAEATWGWQFKDKLNVQRAMAVFRNFVQKYLENHSLKFNQFGIETEFDIEDIDQINSPQKMANTHLDPMVGKLSIAPSSSEFPQEPNLAYVEPKYQLGRIFLRSKENGEWWEGVFDVRPESRSSKIFYQYYQKRFGRKPPRLR